jgi:arsenate reductase (thioredoxin)
MSQALFERITDGRHQARSAGTRPAEQLHPVVSDAMREVGIDVSMNRPQGLTDDLARWADIVVTMGCGDECPYIAGKKYIDWDLTDPADKPLEEVRVIRDDIETRVKALAAELDRASVGR